MAQKEKELLLKDLCMRLPYGVKVLYHQTGKIDILMSIKCTTNYCIVGDCSVSRRDWLDDYKPYLRPMDSMTDEERDELYNITHKGNEDWTFSHNAYVCLDWLNAHHFDYRGLIERGLAIEAPENMYK